MKLNLGCCDRYLAGYLNVDRVPPAEKIVDLDEDWPWADSSVEEIIAHDLIEHLWNKIHAMNEAWRVLRPNGLFFIIVPTTRGDGAFCDPTHVSFWNRRSFDYYEDGNFARTRLGDSYGITARFAIEHEEERQVEPGVWKLDIILRAVK